MYKVLLVDDERMILDGISMIIDWESYGVQLTGKAMNGIEALEFIEKDPPDIVITDITMPGLDGIGLVSKTRERFPAIKWIFLSGYSEFEYAQQAMRYGVRHYLLKPCNEEKISEALTEVVREKKEEDEANEYMQSIQEEALKLHHYEYEDILKKYLIYPQLSEELELQIKEIMWKKFKQPICFIVFFLEDLKEYLSLQTILEKYSLDHEDKELIGTIVGESVVIMEPFTSTTEGILKQYHQRLIRETGQHITTIISRSFTVDELLLFEFRLEHAIAQSFYASSCDFITSQNWINYQGYNQKQIKIVDIDKIIVLLKKKDISTANEFIQTFCEGLKDDNIEPKAAKGYFIQIYLLMMSKYHSNMEENRIEAITRMEDFSHIQQFQQFFHQLFETLIDQQQNPKRYSKVVKQMLECIEMELENPELSLQWIGNHCMFMNPDYLGKLFKKEVGQRFSSYVTNVRINRAVEIIETEEDVKVFELAERMGFGNNPQYFSQLFKRIKGYTPSEIIKSYD